MHEEDYGVLWKHTDRRSGHVEVRRSRRLVISSFIDARKLRLRLFWYLYQDGTIQCEVKLTGIMSMGAQHEGEDPRHGVKCAPGSTHRITSTSSTRAWIWRSTAAATPCSKSTACRIHSSGQSVRKRVACRAHAAAPRNRGAAGHRSEPRADWKICNQGRRNAVGDPVGYKLMPGENVHHMFHDDAVALKRGGFIKHHLWVTQ